MTLVEFLTARLAEDEESARTWAKACVHIDTCEDPGDFTDRFDETRILAEIAAKRAIIQACDDGDECGYCGGAMPEPGHQYWCPESWGDRILLHLAQPHAGHPDFDPAWLQPSTPT